MKFKDRFKFTEPQKKNIEYFVLPITISLFIAVLIVLVYFHASQIDLIEADHKLVGFGIPALVLLLIAWRVGLLNLIFLRLRRLYYRVKYFDYRNH